MSGAEQFVYFVANNNRSFVKIGFSNNPWARLFDLQSGNPEPLVLDLVLRFPTRADAIAYEDALHQHFAAYWHQREWFNYGAPLQDFARQWRTGVGPTIQRPAHTCKQANGPHGRCLSKDEFLATLREKTAA